MPGLYLWEAPNQGGPSVHLERLPGVGGIRGLALGASLGSASTAKRKTGAD